MKYSVGIPVAATIGPTTITFYAAEDVFIPPDDGYMRPPAVCGWCKVTFHFGRFVTSKIIKARHAWDDDYEPTQREADEAAHAVFAQIVARIREHGLSPAVADLAVTMDFSNRADAGSGTP